MIFQRRCRNSAFLGSRPAIVGVSVHRGGKKRWRRAPRVVLRATHEGALSYCSLADLKRFAVDLA
jgi:uncharacterized protein (DUF2237 family)